MGGSYSKEELPDSTHFYGSRNILKKEKYTFEDNDNGRCQETFDKKTKEHLICLRSEKDVEIQRG